MPTTASKATTKPTPKKPKANPRAALRVVDGMLGYLPVLHIRVMRRAWWRGWHASVLSDPAFLAGLADRGLALKARGRSKWIARIQAPT
jgi:hypothetical protein